MSDSPAQPGTPLHGPGGLLGAPGLGRRKGRKWGMRTKATKIVGNLYRANDGKFSAGGDNPVSAKPQRGRQLSKQPKPTARLKPTRAAAPKKGGGGGKAPKSKDPAIAARQAQRDQEHAADRAQRQADRQARLERQATRDAEHVADRAKRQQAALAKLTKPEKVAKPAKAGGGGSKKPKDDKSKVALDTAGTVGISPDDLGALRDAAEGLGGHGNATLTKLGLIGPDGMATDQGRRALSALERGNVRQYQAAIQDATARLGRESGARDRKQQAETRRTAAAQERQAKQQRQAERLKRRAMAGGKLTSAQIDQAMEAGVMDANGTWKSFTTKQTASDRAMFANMGRSGSGGGGSGGGKATGGTGGLYPKGPSGKRTPQAAAAADGGKADAKPGGADRDRALALRDKRDETQRKMRMNTDPSQTQPLFDRYRELDDAVQSSRRSGHISAADAQPIRDTSSTARIPMPKVRNNTADKQRTALHAEADKQRTLAKVYPKGSQGRAAAESKLREIGVKLNKIDDESIKSKSFAVFKDHRGQHRWIARTTTAYRDRDGEIISVAALDADSQRMMATKQFGPLRYWHIGQPDPLNTDAPWGPGVDIGTCDYSVVIGRTRIESGTFRSAAIAQKMAAVADRHEMSPGFLHPLDQPDRDGVFDTIRTFERSTVPVRYGRASNLFTGFTVKEFRMEVPEMERRFKAMYVELGLTPEQGVELGQSLVATEKAATEQGIAFKSEDTPVAELEHPPATPIYFGPDNQPGIIHDGAWVALKAAPPAIAEMKADAPAIAEDVAVDMLDDGDGMDDEAAETGEYVGDMTVAAFESMLTTLLAPVLKMQDMVKSIGVAAKEQSQIAQIAAQLAEIRGNQPAVILPDEVAAAFKSDGPATADPDGVEVPNDPARPFASIAARTMPNLYRNGPAGEFAGWTPPPAV